MFEIKSNQIKSCTYSLKTMLNWKCPNKKHRFVFVQQIISLNTQKPIKLIFIVDLYIFFLYYGEYLKRFYHIYFRDSVINLKMVTFKDAIKSRKKKITFTFSTILFSIQNTKFMRLFYFLHFILLRFCPKNIKSYINKKEIQQKNK